MSDRHITPSTQDDRTVPAERRTPAPRRRLSFTGAGASDRTDISERVEELLREDFGSAR